MEVFICIKMDLALNNLQRFICHKTPTNKQKKVSSLRLLAIRISELISLSSKYRTYANKMVSLCLGIDPSSSKINLCSQCGYHLLFFFFFTFSAVSSTHCEIDESLERMMRVIFTLSLTCWIILSVRERPLVISCNKYV